MLLETFEMKLALASKYRYIYFIVLKAQKLTTVFAMYCKFVDEIRDFLELVGDPSFKAQGDKNKP